MQTQNTECVTFILTNEYCFVRHSHKHTHIIFPVFYSVFIQVKKIGWGMFYMPYCSHEKMRYLVIVAAFTSSWNTCVLRESQRWGLNITCQLGIASSWQVRIGWDPRYDLQMPKTAESPPPSWSSGALVQRKDYAMLDSLVDSLWVGHRELSLSVESERLAWSTLS